MNSIVQSRSFVRLLTAACVIGMVAQLSIVVAEWHHLTPASPKAYREEHRAFLINAIRGVLIWSIIPIPVIAVRSSVISTKARRALWGFWIVAMVLIIATFVVEYAT